MIRNLDEGVCAALRLDARLQGRSLEAQLREVLRRAALPQGRLRLGTELARIGQQVGGLSCAMLRDQRRTLAPAR